jgi:hypothetical protein
MVGLLVVPKRSSIIDIIDITNILGIISIDRSTV